MPFTKIDLAPVLNPVFDKYAQALAAVEKTPVAGARGAAAPTKPAVTKLKTDCLNAAKAEINRQGQIYTKEESAYVKLLVGMHEEGKALSFTVIDLTKKLQQAWNDKSFEELKAKADYIEEMHQKMHDEAQAATAHQAWRSNQPWDFKKAVATVDQNGQDDLFNLFKSHRDPMIGATADLKTLIVKVDEFKARSQDCAKTAASYKGRAMIDAGQFAQEVKGLVVDSVKQVKEVAPTASNNEKALQTFIVLCNSVKTKLDADKQIKPAEQINKGKAIWVKNAKTELKTLDVKIENAKSRAGRSSTPQQFALIQGSLTEAEKNVQAVRKTLDSLSALIDIHSKKIAEAKARK
jgi:hypothetical protein